MQITVADRALTITPVTVRDLPAFLAAVEPIARELAAGDLLGALSRQAEHVIAATAIGSGVEREWLNARTADDLITLASAVIEVNADFFVRRVIPAIEQAAAALNGLTPTGGTPGLPASAAQASAMPT